MVYYSLMMSEKGTILANPGNPSKPIVVNLTELRANNLMNQYNKYASKGFYFYLEPTTKEHIDYLEKKNLKSFEEFYDTEPF